jgi:hypothetical protein
MTKDEALKLALEFVEANHSGGPDAFELIAAIKQARSASVQESEKRECMNCAAFGECNPNNDARRCGYEPPAAQLQWIGLTDESVVSAAARVLSDRVAASCNVDCGDMWMLHGNDSIEDARAMLEAAEAKIKNNT